MNSVTYTLTDNVGPDSLYIEFTQVKILNDVKNDKNKKSKKSEVVKCNRGYG